MMGLEVNLVIDLFRKRERERERERERKYGARKWQGSLEDLGGFDFRDREIGHRGFDSNG